MKLTLGSLFDGIGGFPLAAQQCGIKTLWASEIEPNCIAITKRHFPGMQHLGDITKINGGKIPPVDIISFGSPCQDLSISGKQAGLSGKRSRLFREAVRIIYEMREATNGIYPAFAVWENVPGAFSSNKGEDFRTVLEEITKASIPMPDSGRWAQSGMVGISGADVAWRQMDAQRWGIPQRRKRIFLVADFRGRRAAEILFKPESLLGYPEQGATEKPGITANPGSGPEIPGRNFRCSSEALRYIYETSHPDEAIRINKSGICPALQARMGTGGNQILLVIDRNTMQEQYEKNLFDIAECYPINDAVINGKANGLGIGNSGDPAPTLTGRDRHAIAFFQGQQFGGYKESGTAGTLTTRYGRRSDASILLETEQTKLHVRFILRKLTPLECERLQGFPDEWTRYGYTGTEIKDTPRYTALGNSLAVPCAERIFRGILSVTDSRR